MIVTSDEIVRAAERLADKESLMLGLCWAFSSNDDSLPYTAMPVYLRNLGGINYGGYFWPRNDEGRAQRLTFLAFMLAWHDDIAGRT